MTRRVARLHWLRWLPVFLLSLLWATMGGAASVVERCDFGHSSLAANSGVPGVLHYTSPEGMAAIKAEGAVNPARGGGVHVETGPPFGPARTGAAEAGAYGKGAYVEFDAPGAMRPTNVGPRKTAVMPTDTPLPITDLNPTFKTVPWWKVWAR